MHGSGRLLTLAQGSVAQKMSVTPADVLATVIHRIRQPSGSVACVASYDPHERVWNPPMPLLFQRQIGMDTRAIPAGTIRDWICRSLPDTGPADTGREGAGQTSSAGPDLAHVW